MIAVASVTALVVAATDTDGDGFDDLIEQFIGTDETQPCNLTATPDDEVTDAWPPDFNDDREVGIADVISLRDKYNTSNGDGSYQTRFDLNADGTVNISDVTIIRNRYGEQCDPPAGTGPGSRINWLGEGWYLHGVNVPWYNWSCDFGCGTSGGVRDPSVNSDLHDAFGDLQNRGIHVARWWTFPGDPWQINEDAQGIPVGINAAAYSDFDEALAIAEEYDIYYVFTLFSSPTSVPSGWLEDPAKRSALAGVLGDLFARYSDNPRVLTWQVFNEPEWHIWNGDVQQADVVSTVAEIADSVHANSNAYVSVGSAHLDGLGMWTGIGLDYYTAHWYDYMSSGGWCARCTDYNTVVDRFDLDAPLVIGEFFAGPGTDALQRFEDWYDKGFAGAWAWSLFWDHTLDELQVDLNAAETFANSHADTGPSAAGAGGTPTATATPTATPTPTVSPPPGSGSFPTDPDLVYFAGDNTADTSVSINGDKFEINGVPTYQGRIWNSSLVEGLLLNSRMVNGAYDDLDGSPPSGMLPWDPRANTEDYIANMDDWRAQGLLGIGLNFQGGSNRCNGLHGDGQSSSVDNNPFGQNGTEAFDDWYANQDSGYARYLARIGSIIRQADDLGMVVILGLFYFGQDETLNDEAAVVAAVDAATDWILDNGWTNVIIEVNNESNIGYNHAILQPSRVDELIARIQQRSSGVSGAHLPDGHLLVSTSGGGGYDPQDDWIQQSDFVLLHGNGQSASGVHSMVDAVRAETVWQANPKPIVFNEDSTSLPNFEAAVEKYASWGFFDNNGYQCVYDGNETNRWTLASATESGYWPLVAEIAGVGAVPTPTPAPGSLAIEAETMALSGYQVDGSQSDWIMLSQSASQGTATEFFPGGSGTYNVTINAVAEDDAQSTMELWIDGALVHSFTFPLGSSSRDPFAEMAGTFSLNPGDEVRLVGYKGQASGTSHARVDSISFVLVP